MLEKILVPLDGSVTAEAILPHVRRLLRRHDSEVILLRVANPPAAEDQMLMIEASLAAAREYVVGIKDRLEQQGVRARAEARVGPPAGTVLDLAEEEDVSLIAIATHGRTGLKRALFGSVAETVLRKSPVPVFTVRPFWSYELLPPGRTEAQPFKNILVPTDRSERSIAVLGPAIELARLFEARIVFLHVLDPDSRTKAQGKFSDKALAQERLREFAQKAESRGVKSVVRVEEGDVAKVILETAREAGSDLIAIATHGRTGLSRLVTGSVTEEVLRKATLPLLVVRSQKPARKAKKAAPKAVGKGKR
ncbi:MAG TPA: universal stress protein [Planctomycetota bacterium]|nr:universal stress protein [Planctomycetota bacterium]